MATKEKKPTLGKKNLTLSKDPNDKPKPDQPDQRSSTSSLEAKPTPKRLSQKRSLPSTKAIKKTSIKAKSKRPLPLNKKFTILRKAKTLIEKKALLKNGSGNEVKPKRISKKTPKLVAAQAAKPSRQRSKPKMLSEPAKPEVEGEEASDSPKAKKARLKKAKAENETLDDVMKDLSFLIKSSEGKESDSQSESSKSDSAKRKAQKKDKLDLSKLKKDIDATDRKVIDMLDLNVANLKKQVPVKRRHSIEKFPIGTEAPQQFQVFTNLPRSISPRSKRNIRVRQSVDSRRSSPYTTRSDSPARILRNGKHRKLKDLTLLDGLETEIKRRRRLCSDLSGSEMSISKLSGYESDSSFSDLASLASTDNVEGQKRIKEEPEVKRRLSEETNGPTDANSNIYEEEKALVDINLNNPEIKQEPEAKEDDANGKLPNKNKLLDIMKQTFNEAVKEEALLKAEQAQRKKKAAKPPEVQVKQEVIEMEEKDPVAAAEGEAALPTVEETPVPGEVDKENVLPEQEEKNGEQEDKTLKENMLNALGLQSCLKVDEVKPVQKAKVPPRTDNYSTGTLKTVIKINRDKKKGRNSLKMTLQKNKKGADGDAGSNDDNYKIMKDGGSHWKQGNQSSDTAGAHRKSHYSNRSNMDGSSENTSDGETTQDGAAKALVIPEKASSFSIHPGRLCNDECSYCFGKFGLFDTPCHIAQMKSVERQNKILESEKQLTRDSCLCDACYRHVDRKSNTPSYTNKSHKRNSLVAPVPRQNHCHVLNCSKVSTNILRRKWIIKMRKSICQVINIDLDNPGLHSIPICDEHYSALEHLMICAMCKRRLARNHIHYLGPEIDELNTSLKAEGIPLKLSDKPVVCKLCKCFASVVTKDPEERPENSVSFFEEYKKRLLHFNDIVPMDEAAAEEPIVIPAKEKIEQVKKRKKRNAAAEVSQAQEEQEKETDQNSVPSENQSRPESPSDFGNVDYNTLIPAINMECESDDDKYRKKDDADSKKVKSKTTEVVVQRLGSNPSISVRQLFPGEEELPLQGSIDFGNVKERTVEGWEKYTSVVQFDLETKKLWQELQKPYGNQSSFLRHLILLEKYFRNGDLTLSPNASHHSVNYSESVSNRLRAYDNIPSSASNIQPISMMQFNAGGKLKGAVNVVPVQKAAPLSIAQVNSVPAQPAKLKPVGAPPGLISLHPGTNRPVQPLVKTHSQKIKFPITKSWRPNLIPIDPKKPTERKTGLVQVISGGKPFHITLEDYKKMCAIKRNFEMKQKRLENQKPGSPKAKATVMKAITVTKAKSENSEGEESILEKLDRQVEKLSEKAVPLPKIPKSLTVIPQTVPRKPSRPSSPILIITKNKS